ncbi:MULTISPECIES: preprotein translocase subunit SecE [unclassified Gordonia (in: high G+C Gram-positive bacteria)]|uniref:preprotein translocase subunit SecE n=1 Tax=unclassified Gordonia (in: high G+C Gram-positive bacteria) TaxID=2657482 RepID=UPI001FFE8F02|nr:MULTISPECIES: preprotein translocase subunit SecE [unclassified Gordonia (in: high G+C Gram-positive bacteria)]UQE74556.1 preprotein translocase subunit SecE [Gordonia sp. PP30]
MAKRDRKAPENDAEPTTGGDVDTTGIDVDVIEADEMRPRGKRRARERRTAGGDTLPGKVGVVDVAAEEGDADGGRNPFVRIWIFLRQVVAELKKVIWPTRREMVVYAIAVLIFVALVTAVISGLDIGFAKLALLVFG